MVDLTLVVNLDGWSGRMAGAMDRGAVLDAEPDSVPSGAGDSRRSAVEHEMPASASEAAAVPTAPDIP